jgi:glucose-1-phosphate thymidylyltransferase
MNALVLAAGYATRLYPLTLNKAKPLLEVAGKPIIEWLADSLALVPGLEAVYIVTNSKFAADFRAWADGYQKRFQSRSGPQAGSIHPIKIIDDGSTSDQKKLGAIGDIHLVLTRENLGGSDLLIVAGDNLFNESLAGFVERAKSAPATVAIHDVGNLEAMKKYGCVVVDGEGKIMEFEEKPAKPKSTLAALALYYYSRDVLPFFETYLAAGNNPDQPGRFLQWLYRRVPVATFQLKGAWLDIGSKETLEKANAVFAKRDSL